MSRPNAWYATALTPNHRTGYPFAAGSGAGAEACETQSSGAGRIRSYGFSFPSLNSNLARHSPKHRQARRIDIDRSPRRAHHLGARQGAGDCRPTWYRLELYARLDTAPNRRRYSRPCATATGSGRIAEGQRVARMAVYCAAGGDHCVGRVAWDGVVSKKISEYARDTVN